MKSAIEESVIIEPRRGRAESDVEELVFLFFLPRDLKIAYKVLGLDQSTRRRVDFAKLYNVNQEGKRFSIAGPAMGAPIAVILLERLVALGARNIVGVGSCGSLQEDIRIGDYIIPTHAIVEEGTSQHYPSDNVIPRASGIILKSIEDCCVTNNLSFTMGKVWTTDAPFRETTKKTRTYKNQNVLGVEMEMSALFTVGTFRGVDVGGFLVVSDELSAMRWKTRSRDKKYSSALKTACEALFKHMTIG